MGAADIIPGVSGGTIAFVTGIYEELVEAIRSVNFIFFLYFIRGLGNRDYLNKAHKAFHSIHFRFLLPLLAGIVVAFLLLANIIGFLRESFPTYSAAFFFGLIIASAFIVYSLIGEKLSATFIVSAIGGGLVGFTIVGLVAIQLNHSLFVVFISGIITICAMLLPGVSGAFILWFLGQYDFMLGILREVMRFNFSHVVFIIIYICGALIGLLLFSRLLSFLLRYYRIVTLSFLLGLMMGALRKPVEIILVDPQNMGITVLSAAIGVIIVGTFAVLTRGRKNKKIIISQ